MSQSASDVARAEPAAVPAPAVDEPLVVEAPTAAKALARVTAVLGPDATIVAANKVTRGGIAGFFVRELVQLQARPRAAGEEAAGEGLTGAEAAGDRPAGETGSGPSDGAAAGDGATAVNHILSRLAADVQEQETTFADALRRQLSLTEPAGGPSGKPPAPAAAAPPAPASTAPRAPGRDWPRPRWSDRNLRLLGLPALVTDAVAGLHLDDDLAWVQAVAGALSTLCRPLPDGPAVFAGPRAQRLGGGLDLPVHKPPSYAPVAGSFAAVVRDTDPHRAWLDRNRGGRWLHLVVGGDDWRGLLLDEPLAVSWVSDRALGDAVRLCAELGLVLGYETATENGAPGRRANPVDVALAIRSLLPR